MPDPIESNIAVLASGGLDSSVLASELARQGRIVHPIYIQFGLRWEEVEEQYLRRFLASLPASSVRPLVTMSLPIADVYARHWSVCGDVPDSKSADEAVYLPGRNLLLLAKASVWCALHDVQTIALGTLQGNPFPDSTRDFFDRFGSLADTALSTPLKVVTPFAGSSKTQVLELGRDLNLHNTFSCIVPQAGLHCGRCNKCAERQRAFQASSIPDTTAYLAH